MRLDILVVIFVLGLGFFARAERFDNFLQSLESRFPVDTEYMQSVLREHKTRLAHPSLLERWGLINTQAAASYNEVLNTVILKEDYTVGFINSQGEKSRRVRNLAELQQVHPSVWPVRMGTIFHELTHAEYSWLPKSTYPVDIALLKMMKTEFDDYLKDKFPKLSKRSRIIAQSEMLAYFRADYLAHLLSTIDDLIIENGYFSTSGSCKNTPAFVKRLVELPRNLWSDFVTFGPDQNFTTLTLPAFFVKGQDLSIEPTDPLTQKLQMVLWNQAHQHYKIPRSKFEVLIWMNSRPELKNLIKSCRDFLLNENR